MKVVVTALVVVLCLLAVQIGTAGAVSADETGLGFDAAGQKVQNTSRNVVVPLLVFGGLLVLAVSIGIGMRAAGVAVRWVVMCVLLIIVCTGAGLGTFFPGLITTLTLP